MKREISQSNKAKSITTFIKYLTTNEEYEISIDVSKKVKDLKKEIEKLLHIQINHYLIIKRQMK